MNPHERARREVTRLVAVDGFILESPITAHCLEVDTVCHTIDCMENWVYFVEELHPSLHVVCSFHVAGECRWFMLYY
jgi:hypothetical protein